MAKGKPAGRRTAAGSEAEARVSPADPAREKAGQAIEKIRKYYAVGTQVLQGLDDGQRYDGKTVAEAAARLGTEGDSVRKAREFARAYTPAQLEELCGLRTPDGEPLTWSHVRWLIQVKDPVDRSELQAGAAREGWSSRQLGAEVRRRRGGKTAPGGRTFDVPSDPEAVRRKLVELTRQWLRLYEAFGDTEGAVLRVFLGGSLKGHKTADLAGRLGGAVEALRRLVQLSDSAAGRRAAGGKSGDKADG